MRFFTFCTEFMWCDASRQSAPLWNL